MMLAGWACEIKEPGELRTEEPLESGSSGGGRIASLSFCEPVSFEPLVFLEEAPEEPALVWARLNQLGNPCLKLNPPGGSLSSSVALTVSELDEPVV